MDANAITTPLAAFTAGLVTSVHCSGMCGPLSCAMLSSKTSRSFQLSIAVYHATRFASYALIGGLLGAIGSSAAALFSSGLTHFVPWALAGVLLVFGFGLEKRIPQPKFLSRVFLRLKLASMPKAKLGALLGFMTPFLPCAPLYLVFGVAVFAGSFAGGAGLMGAFALGTLPLYWLVQSQFFRIPWSPGALRWTRQGLALISCALLVWRVVANDGVALADVHCPFCR